MRIRTILYGRIQTPIKHVFLFDFPHELLMNLIMCFTRTVPVSTVDEGNIIGVIKFVV